MFRKVEKFLLENKIAVLSIVDLEGFPHSATMHYAMSGDSMVLYFLTEKHSHKTQTILHGETVNASVVIGFSEKEWRTVQMEGIAHLALIPQEIENAQIAYYAKFPTAEKKENLVFLVFKPLFWKYTDYSEKPWKIMTSEDK